MSVPLGPINPDDPALQVYRNLPPRPSKWKLLLARIMGEPKYHEYRKGVLITWQMLNGERLLAAVEYLPEKQ
jgi:hypothetical protein